MLEFFFRVGKKAVVGVSIFAGVLCSPILLPAVITGAVTSFSMLTFWNFVTTIFKAANIIRVQSSPVTAKKEVAEGLPSLPYIERAPEIKEVKEEQKYEKPFASKVDQKPEDKMHPVLEESPAQPDVVGVPEGPPLTDTKYLEIPTLVREESAQDKGVPKTSVDIPVVSETKPKKKNRKEREAEELRARDLQEEVRKVKKQLGLPGDVTGSLLDETDKIVDVVFDGHKPEGTEVIVELRDVARAIVITKEEIGIA